MHIGGPASIKVGANESTIERFVVVPLAGTERLRGAYQGGVAPSWSLAPDCDGVAEFAPVLGSSDTGGADITRSLRPIKPGTCTINASVLGLETAKPVTIK